MTTSPTTPLLGEIERLRMALTDVVNPLGNLRRYAEENGTTLNGDAYGIANNLGFVQRIAKAALEEDASWLGHHSARKPSGSTQNCESSTEKAEPAKPSSLSLTPSNALTATDRPTSLTSSSTPKHENSDQANLRDENTKLREAIKAKVDAIYRDDHEKADALLRAALASEGETE